jgi:hypothetical protein
MTEPKCPECTTSGIDNFAATPSKQVARDNTPWYYVAHCASCGHVYGIFTKHVYGRSGPQLIVEGKK